MTTPTVEAVRGKLKAEGRSIAWLAERVDASTGHVYNVLGGHKPASAQLLRDMAEALGFAVTVVQFRGRTIAVDSDIYSAIVAKKLDDPAAAALLKVAWKRDWLEEYGAQVLTDAVERAYDVHRQLVAAELVPDDPGTVEGIPEAHR